MTELNYQWPIGAVPTPASYLTGKVKVRDAFHQELEKRFSTLLGYPSIVVPSGRAALSLAFQLAGVGRRHIIFAPKYSSHCVWNLVGRYGNPTINMTENVDIILAVHQFGQNQISDRPLSLIPVIEDSCDTIVLNPEGLFPNNGNMELFSLPKIMGCYGGGLLTFKDHELFIRARKLISDSNGLSDTQGYMRWSIASGLYDNYDNWDANEYRNLVPDYMLVRHLLENFNALALNIKTIKSRLQRLTKLGWRVSPDSDIDFTSSRLPPVLTTNIFHSNAKVMQRYVNRSAYFNKPDYVKMAIIPLHFGVKESRFEELLNELNV